MDFLTGATQEIMNITDPRDKTIPIDTTKPISYITHDQLIASRDTIHVTEAQVNSEIIQATVLITHADQLSIAL